MRTQAELQTPSPWPVAEESPGGGGLLGSPFLFLAAMLLLMWALIIRPQQRHQKQHKAMLSKVQKGDMVVTSGGIHGKVMGVTDDILTVEIADRVRVKLSRSSVASRSQPAPQEKS